MVRLQRLERLLLPRVLLDAVRSEVRRHDHDGVLEVDGTALRVREAPVVEDLEQDVEDVLVRLFDLVEQEHGVGPAPYRLGQLAGLLVADVAGRSADEARDGVPLLELAHVEADHQVLVAEERLCKRPCELGLADARRAEEEEAADRPAGVAEPMHASGWTASAIAATASSWPTTRPCSYLLEPHEACAFLGRQL